jgi:antitoxin MazE
MTMATQVKVRKWGNSLGVRLPKSFAAQRSIMDGATVDIDQLKIVDVRPRRRSKYKLSDLLKNYLRRPDDLDFPAMGKEMP